MGIQAVHRVAHGRGAVFIGKRRFADDQNEHAGVVRHLLFHTRPRTHAAYVPCDAVPLFLHGVGKAYAYDRQICRMFNRIQTIILPIVPCNDQNCARDMRPRKVFRLLFIIHTQFRAGKSFFGKAQIYVIITTESNIEKKEEHL